MAYEAWRYRKSHVITASTAVTEYAVKITVHRTVGTDSGKEVYVGTKCQSDYRDVRFTNSSGTPLPYYLDKDKHDDTYADIWVNIDAIGESTTIYVYYGYENAMSASNGYNVFLFFTDFTDYGADGTGYLPYGVWANQSGLTKTRYDGYITATPTGTGRKTLDHYTNPLDTGNHFWPYLTKYFFRASVSGHTTTNISGVGVGTLEGGGAGFIYQKSGKIVAHTYQTAKLQTDLMDIDTDEHEFEIHHISASLIKYRIDGGEFTSFTEQVPIAAKGYYTSYLHLSHNTTSGTYPTIISKLVFVAKTLDTEPVHSTWGDETDMAPTPLAGWGYRKQHLITNAGSDLTEYQVQINVHYGEGTDSGADVYLNGKCESNFRDIRFGDAQHNLYPSAIERSTDSSVAIFWVKLPTITSSNTIYLYYGNADAQIYNDTDEVFDFYDTFDGATLNTKKWYLPGGNIDATVADGAVKLCNNNLSSEYTENFILTTSMTKINHMIRVRLKNGCYPPSLIQGFDLVGPSMSNRPTTYGSYNSVILFPFDRTYTTYIKVWTEKEGVNPSSYISTSFDARADDSTNYHIYDIKWLSGPTIKISYDGTEILNHSNSTYLPISGEPICINGSTISNAGAYPGDATWYDYVLRVKVAATEPIHSTWGEEEPAFITAPFKSRYHLGAIVAAFVSKYSLGEFATFVSRYRIASRTGFVSRYAIDVAAGFTSIYKIIIGKSFRTDVKSDSSTAVNFRTRIESAKKTIAAIFEER